MSDTTTVTEADLARDLRADLERATDNHGPNWGRTPAAAQLAYGEFAEDALPAALRRAIDAEARLAATYCAYCGHEVRIDADASLISEHIRTCEKHPMRDVEAERDALAAAATRLAAQVEESAGRLSAVQQERDDLRRLLALMYRKYENGTPCGEVILGEYVEGSCIGNAVSLSSDEDAAILAALKEGTQS
jgi:hypothetical protein